MKMARTVSKSASTGRFVSRATVARNPGGTVRQTVGSRATGYRSASTGRFVTAATAARHPGKTIKE
jgi:hypothetical protein